MTDNEIIKALECCTRLKYCDTCPFNHHNCKKMLDYTLDLIKRQQAEIKRYKDLEEQGRLIELPCKVGDKVYAIEGNDISENKMTKIFFNTDGRYIFGEEVVGKSVFITKAEAEAKLKEMVGTNNDR